MTDRAVDQICLTGVCVIECHDVNFYGSLRFNRQITSELTVDRLATKDKNLRFAEDAACGTDRVIKLGTLHAATSR